MEPLYNGVRLAAKNCTAFLASWKRLRKGPVVRPMRVHCNFSPEKGDERSPSVFKLELALQFWLCRRRWEESVGIQVTLGGACTAILAMRKQITPPCRDKSLVLWLRNNVVPHTHSSPHSSVSIVSSSRSWPLMPQPIRKLRSHRRTRA
jgi:hypothetical protein